jgi:hypothetical protein
MSWFLILCGRWPVSRESLSRSESILLTELKLVVLWRDEACPWLAIIVRDKVLQEVSIRLRLDELISLLRSSLLITTCFDDASIHACTDNLGIISTILLRAMFRDSFLTTLYSYTLIHATTAFINFWLEVLTYRNWINLINIRILLR